LRKFELDLFPLLRLACALDLPGRVYSLSRSHCDRLSGSLCAIATSLVD